MGQTKLAALMGDLVASGSTDFGDIQPVFNAAVDRANAAAAGVVASPLTITLGDEFQGLLKSMAAAAPVMRRLRLDLLVRGIDCRFALGLVSLATPLNPHRAWNMMGEGLARTRERLNEKRGDNLYRFVIPGEPAIEPLLESLGAALTAIERRWTEAQADVAARSLAGASPAEIASARNVSAHSVYKVRSAGDLDRYVMHWSAIQDALRVVDRTRGMT